MQDGNTIEIRDLTTYLKKISALRQEITEGGENKRLFSRGQENINWDILPTVFRESLLKDEAKMIRGAYARNPSDFRNYILPFERLTKLQHYGLCTRLLDVTLNPMVALYFACQKCDEIETIIDADGKQDQQKVSGAVYCQLDYGNSFDSPEVRILSAISEMDMENMTLESCLSKLEENGTLLRNHAIAYQKNDYREFIKILQEDYFVVPNFSNERLIRQSGAFLLPGCINVIKNEENIGESIIQKAKDSLRSKFTSRIFEIPADAKADILDELDMYNINEASLFPELEHQMRYIKSIHMNTASGMIDTFSKITWKAPVEEHPADIEQTIITSPSFQDDPEKMKEIIRNTVDRWTPEGISKEDIFKIFEDNMVVDWYKKDQVLSKIRTEINRSIEDSKGYAPDGSKKWANVIVNMVISEIQETMGIEDKTA